MSMKQREDYTTAALYARVTSDRQDVDLSVEAQLRALRDYAEKNGYLVVREYIDEAESGRIADRPQFQRMLDAAAKPSAPFQEILVWKFSRFTRKREHAVAFKSMLRRRGVRVTSITEHADDSPTGKLMEAIIESVDEFYSENLAQDVSRGMREAASRGFWMGTYAPFGYRKVYVQDGVKTRPKLEPDPPADAVVKRIFDMALQGKSSLDIAKALNAEGVASPRGKQWLKSTVYTTLNNETYTGAVVWGVSAKDGAPPVRVEKAHPALVSKRKFRQVAKLLRSRAPETVHPRRASSPYLLSGLLKCETCGKALTAAEAKSGKYTYYVCHSLLKRGSGTCKTPRLNAKTFEKLIVDEIRANILTESNIRDLVKLLDEEMDGVASEQRERLESIEEELEEVKRRLGRIWQVIETTDIEKAALGPAVVPGQRRHHRHLRRGHERVPQDQRADRDQGVRPLLRQGGLGQARQGRHRLLHTYAGGLSDRGADAAEVALNGRVRSSVRHGGDRGTRTPNLGIANAALSQLSYIPTRPPAQLYQTAPAHRQFEAPAGSDQPLCRTTSPCVDCRSKAAYGILPWAKGPAKPAKQDSERKEERRTVCNRRYWHRPPISRRRR